jgi:acylphosphatase
MNWTKSSPFSKNRQAGSAESAMQQRKAILATVIGDDQHVGFRAMIMKQAIEYNLAGSAKNEANGTVHFTLQGNSDGLDEALAAIRASDISGTHFTIDQQNPVIF